MTLSAVVHLPRRRRILAATAALLAALILGGTAAPALAQDTDSGGSVSTGQGAGRAYVALGDSFTGGQGAPPYQLGPCLRSKFASYPAIAAAASAYRLVSNNACSGASLADVPGQLLGISGSTKLITITVGGIDAGSNEVFAACALDPGSTGCQAAVILSIARLAALAPQLAATYAGIAAAVPGAKIVVLNYPRLFQPGILALGDIVNSGTDRLNAVIRDAVVSVGLARVSLVDVAQEFTNHGIGARLPFIAYDPANPLAKQNFHPNALGNSLGYVRALLHDGVLSR
ncbi:hypothetical protein GY21_03880 [Cryobacterium roopkundense]|uniref:Lysophospholipase L1-like esterase n=1 Tax=Cryobacterium roopkundense TaxID=1001240 RepID=A0A099JNS0_9MICO|nr:GDSL-type esterase/lipase family protein [Cryobacterium roopkundense]KGJ79800.1 hypothetical protein GY21_03880 [Cryobacterium roopkundense]MBB5640297.1 lysophospholipase L1-like esterase [Cryobacterium roopkundense]